VQDLVMVQGLLTNKHLKWLVALGMFRASRRVTIGVSEVHNTDEENDFPYTSMMIITTELPRTHDLNAHQ
jgi:hypothetical protein